MAMAFDCSSWRWVAYGLRAPLAAIPDPSRRTRILLHQAHRRPDLKRVHLRTSKWGTCTSPGLLERGIAVRQGLLSAPAAPRDSG